MDELLHHWQISLISQGRVWVCIHRHTHTHTHVHACTQRCVCGHTHAFYQSNLIGKSMLWLTNRELMQSRGLSSPLPPPVSIFTYLSLSCPSPPLTSSLSLPFSLVSFCGKQQNNICTQSADRLVKHGRQTDGLSDNPWILPEFLLNNTSLTSSIRRKTGVSSFSTHTQTHEYTHVYTFNG